MVEYFTEGEIHAAEEFLKDEMDEALKGIDGIRAVEGRIHEHNRMVRDFHVKKDGGQQNYPTPG